MNLCSPIDERLPVWTALSQLFLDTELSLDDIVRVADLLARAPYEIPELERILVEEVLPAFAPNLIAPAGEWTSWSESEVRSIMEKAEGRGYFGKWLADLTALPVKRAVLTEWSRVLPLLERSCAQAAQAGSVRREGSAREAGNARGSGSVSGDGA